MRMLSEQSVWSKDRLLARCGPLDKRMVQGINWKKRNQSKNGTLGKAAVYFENWYARERFRV